MGVQSLSVSYLRARRAEGIRPTTLALYADCIRRLVRFMETETGSDDVAGLTRRLLTDFYGVRAETCAQATVWTDWKAHRCFLRWLHAEGDLTTDPMERMKPPRQTSKPVPVLTEAELTRLVAACEGRSRRDRRDMAAMRLLIEGLRRGEVCSLTVDAVDLDAGVCVVNGKGGKIRTLALGSKTVAALDRWLRTRPASPSTALTRPLLELTPSGLYQALRARAEAAGIDDWHPHRMRHTAAHRWLVAHGNEGDLMEVMGWSSASMLRRYGASASAERARQAQRDLGLSDQI